MLLGVRPARLSAYTDGKSCLGVLYARTLRQPRVHTRNTPYIRMTESGLRIRVDAALRREFLEACKAKDTTAAQVLRAFMRAYVEQHGAGVRQPDLFAADQSSQSTSGRTGEEDK